MPFASPRRSPHANYLAGECRPAKRAATFRASSEASDDTWPQSDGEDLALAWQAARAAQAEWSQRSEQARGAHVLALAQALERDELLPELLGRRFALTRAELGAHVADPARALGRALPRAVSAANGIAWCAPDWRELVGAPLGDLARELLAGRVVVLLSDPLVPELGQHLALAAGAAGLPAGVFALLHGARRELLALALERAEERDRCALVASGLVERMAELRRLEGRGRCAARLRAVRCGVHEVDPAVPLEASAAEVIERAFGRARTLAGQLAGALGRVFCPARLFSRFTELCLERLTQDEAGRAPLAQIDEESAARVRAAWALGLDEGATCIAGGDEDAGAHALPPTIFTNVESYMSSARRQDPLPVLCLLRGT